MNFLLSPLGKPHPNGPFKSHSLPAPGLPRFQQWPTLSSSLSIHTHVGVKCNTQCSVIDTKRCGLISQRKVVGSISFLPILFCSKRVGKRKWFLPDKQAILGLPHLNRLCERERRRRIEGGRKEDIHKTFLVATMASHTRSGLPFRLGLNEKKLIQMAAVEADRTKRDQNFLWRTKWGLGKKVWSAQSSYNGEVELTVSK